MSVTKKILDTYKIEEGPLVVLSLQNERKLTRLCIEQMIGCVLYKRLPLNGKRKLGVLKIEKI